MVTDTVKPTLPVPVTVGAAEPTEPVGPVTTGAEGTTAIIVTLAGDDSADSGANGTVCVAASIWVERLSAEDKSQLHVPSAETVTVQSTTPPSLTCTDAPDVPIPVTVGVVSVVVVPEFGATIVGAPAGAATIDTVVCAETGETFPASSD
jgi:hypothetical protein